MTNQLEKINGWSNKRKNNTGCNEHTTCSNDGEHELNDHFNALLTSLQT
jgi:hypothetical protein